ncbi:hypothetical protein BC828DRAFT_386053, partial [Blastocladiella britannica]
MIGLLLYELVHGNGKRPLPQTRGQPMPVAANRLSEWRDGKMPVADQRRRRALNEKLVKADLGAEDREETTAEIARIEQEHLATRWAVMSAECAARGSFNGRKAATEIACAWMSCYQAVVLDRMARAALAGQPWSRSDVDKANAIKDRLEFTQLVIGGSVEAIAQAKVDAIKAKTKATQLRKWRESRNKAMGQDGRGTGSLVQRYIYYKNGRENPRAIGGHSHFSS